MTIVSERFISDVKAERPLPISRAFSALPPPLLIVGMHRSGTSLVAGMLATLGVYVDPLFGDSSPEASPSSPGADARRNGYGEAVAFRLVNEAVMGRAGATWKHVTPFLARRDRPGFAAGSLLRMQAATFTSLQKGYLKAFPGTAPLVWGWKDPRNSLLLPYWLRLFPNARILHVRRSPEGVVDSLQRREAALRSAPHTAASLTGRLRRLATHPTAALSAVGRRCGIVSRTPSAHQSQDWWRLSEQYVSECLKYRHHPGGYLEVSYESILNEPICSANQLADFVCAGIPLTRVLRAAAFVLVDNKGAEGSRK